MAGIVQRERDKLRDSSPIPARLAGTLDGLFRERVRLSASRPAYSQYDRNQKVWCDFSWADMAVRVHRWQNAIQREEIKATDRVALLLPNSVDWVAFEQAAMGLGLVLVPLYPDDRPDNVAYILNDAGVKLLLLNDSRQWQQLAPHISENHRLQRIVVLNGEPEQLAETGHEHACLANDWLTDVQPGSLHERGGSSDELATIVYTSGTTGRPRGVMLSHRNILATAENVITHLQVEGEHRMLSFLPLSHMFERTTGYYAGMMYGMQIAFNRSIQQLADDMLTIQPTILIAVPRIFERLHERISKQLAGKSTIVRSLFHLTVTIGWQRFQHQQGRARWRPSLLLWPLLDRLVAEKVRDRFGGHLQIAASGGAALSPAIARIFIGLGLNILQGYGLTETSPIISANTIAKNDPASVGNAIPGLQLKIGEHDELLSKGPGNMLGYWNNHQATSEIIDPEGWLHTGDKASIRDGFIYITGRIKDILILSNGEKIPPMDMECAISLDPLFEQALVVGEGRPYLSALVVLNAEHWVTLAKAHLLDPFDPNSLRNKAILTDLQHRISQALHDFPGYAKIRRVHPLLEEWNIENDLMTPTLKIKRTRVLAKYEREIETMYNS